MVPANWLTFTLSGWIQPKKMPLTQHRQSIGYENYPIHPEKQNKIFVLNGWLVCHFHSEQWLEYQNIEYQKICKCNIDDVICINRVSEKKLFHKSEKKLHKK